MCSWRQAWCSEEKSRLRVINYMAGTIIGQQRLIIARTCGRCGIGGIAKVERQQCAGFQMFKGWQPSILDSSSRPDVCSPGGVDG